MKWPFSINNKANDDYYYGLFLKEEEGISFIFQGRDKSITVIAKEKFSYSNGWENLTEDVDDAFSKLENQKKVSVKKAILFVYSHLVDKKTSEIKRPYLLKIKALIKSLEIKPLGYVECSDAVSAYLEEKNSLPLTSILIEIDKLNLSVFVFKSGRKIFEETISRTGNIIDDLSVIVNKTKGGLVLPSRIILYNSTNLSDEAEKIISYRWNTEAFIQPPRVEVIGEGEVIQSLINLFEKQIYSPDAKTNHWESLPERPAEEILGFVINGDVQAVGTRTADNNKFQSVGQNDFYKPVGKLLNKLRTTLRIGSGLDKNISVLIGLFLIVGSFASGEYFLHRAEVTVFFPAQTIEKSLNLSDKDLPIHVATMSAQFNNSKSTTGTKAVGDKAKGEVTLYNFDDKEKVFQKGTEISTGSLGFSLDNDIKVASASLTTDASAKLPGKAKVNVNSVSIGSEGNIAKGQRFSVANLPETTYFAINEASFTGGSKKDIRTVSKNDVDGLKSTILEASKKSVLEQISSQIKSDERLLDQLTTMNLDNIKISKEVGEESNNLDLKADVVTTYYFYERNQLAGYLKSLVTKDIPTGRILLNNQIDFIVKNVTKEKNKVSLSVDLTAKSIKDVDKNLILEKITGKSKASAGKILKTNFEASGLELKVKPSGLDFIPWLPIIKKNIDLGISSL